MSDSGTARGRIHPEAGSSSLDPADWGEFREQAHRMLDDMLGYIETIRKRPVWQVIPDEVRARFREALSAKPMALAQVHDEFMTSILPFAAGNAHPGFFGWVQGGGTAVGMLAEMLAAGLNANVGGRDQIPLEVERQVTGWMRTLFGFPSGATGLFVTGTSMANLLAVVVARDARLGCEVRRHGIDQRAQKLTAYASAAVHGSVGRALDCAGLGSEALRRVPVDSRQRIDLKELAGAIAADRAAGFTPFLVVGTAGTVDTGAIDDLAGIARTCAHERLWFHVDGAFGALAMLASELRPRLKGIEQADSLAFDFHKWAQVPYDAGFILVRDGARHHQAFASSCAYLVREERGLSAGSPWPCDFGLDLSRGFRALKTWATLKVYGADAIGAVISRTCDLARYLESRIALTPELELMAPVELNIVCFRYRSRSPADSATDELFDQLNRQIVIELQESGAVAPSTTIIANRLAIRAAIVNHRTGRADIDTLVERTLTAGRALLPRTVSSAERAESKWQPWLERDGMVRQLDALLDRHEKARTDRLKVLALEPSHQQSLNGLGRLLIATVQRKADDRHKEVEVALRVKRATLLAQMGRSLEAKNDHLKVLELEPSHRVNLIGLGRLLLAAGQRKAAQVIYAEAVKHHPEDIVSRVNLGGSLLEGDDPAGALAQFEIALQIDPEFPQAQRGMYYALIRLGKSDSAERHRRKAFGQRNLFPALYRGDSQPIPVVLLVSSTGGNTPIEKLLDDRVFQTYVVIADFYDGKTPLPPHQLIVNGVGDPDAAAQALVAAESLIAVTSTPVLNPPAAVRATGRCENARRLGNLAGILSPATAMFPHALLAGPDGPDSLARRGFTFPLLLRTPGFHMGKHFVRVDSPAELAAAVTGLPEAERPGAELLAIEYLDARGADGCARKYRVMMVDGRLYPLHLAISRNWKVHYFSADMADRPEHRDEEARFLADMPGVLGNLAVAALERVQSVLGLDYGGIDFGLNQRGEILLFEANATMVVMPPDADKRWDYRRAAVERIHAAVHQMLMTSAARTPAFGEREYSSAPTFCEPREMNPASL